MSNRSASVIKGKEKKNVTSLGYSGEQTVTDFYRQHHSAWARQQQQRACLLKRGTTSGNMVYVRATTWLSTSKRQER